jgi:ssDNA-binding Zn-finger/Zn-ribbon topoisomerase 1
MSQTLVQEVVTGKVTEVAAEKELVPCQKCEKGKVRRVFRDGFLQTTIFPLLGYYPWRCSRCGRVVMLRKRHRARIKNSETYSRRK